MRRIHTGASSGVPPGRLDESWNQLRTKRSRALLLQFQHPVHQAHPDLPSRKARFYALFSFVTPHGKSTALASSALRAALKSTTLAIAASDLSRSTNPKWRRTVKVKKSC